MSERMPGDTRPAGAPQTPATIRHSMMMKYGYASANLGITSPPPRPAGPDRLPSDSLSSRRETHSGFRLRRDPLPPIRLAVQREGFPAIPIALSVLPEYSSRFKTRPF